MKRTLEIQVECAERLCGACWAVDESVHARRCRIFWVKLNPYGPPAERCGACLAAEVPDDREELLHLVERQAKELAALRQGSRWRSQSEHLKRTSTWRSRWITAEGLKGCRGRSSSMSTVFRNTFSFPGFDLDWDNVLRWRSMPGRPEGRSHDGRDHSNTGFPRFWWVRGHLRPADKDLSPLTKAVYAVLCTFASTTGGRATPSVHPGGGDGLLRAVHPGGTESPRGEGLP